MTDGSIIDTLLSFQTQDSVIAPMSKRMTATLVTDSLRMAILKRKPKSDLLIHSDMRSQYVSDSYQKLLSENKFICNMSRKGNCWGNSIAESFFHTLRSWLIMRILKPEKKLTRQYLNILKYFIIARESIQPMIT